MTEIVVRALTEDEWELLRSLRLNALRESPDAFVASYDDEADESEDFWRARLSRSRRLVAEADGEAAGLVSIGTLDGVDNGAEFFGLWVAPQWRGRSIAANLVKSGATYAAEQGCDRIAYWVGTDNGRAVAFASGFGFRPTGRRRPMRVQNGDGDEEEIAMVLPLTEDRRGF